MNFSQLHFIKAISELNSFSLAAKQCNVTQPTLSNAISKFEQEIKNKIFQRTTRSVELTQFGRDLLPKILEIIALQSQITSMANKNTSSQNVTIKIGFSPLVNSKKIIEISTFFQNENSNVKIIFVEDNLSVLENNLKHETLDIILIPAIETMTRPNEMPLYQENLLLVSAQNKAIDSVNFEDLREETFVMVPDTCGLASITRTLFRTHTKSINEYEGKALSYQVLAEWAQNGFGLAVLPHSKVHPNTQTQTIMKAGKPITIAFKAKWASTSTPLIRKLLTYFSKNLENF
ncbi:MAG: LysR family transcriptional regulator [Robiginitomaculum sp.]|nr:MAG: LysR family transcriptional regulator [Robiginitomaculum sp.]